MSDARAFEFGSQTQAAKAEEPGDGPVIIATFPIDGVDFDVIEQLDSSIAHLIHRVNSTKNSAKIISAVFGFMERAMTPESAERFEEMVLGTDGGAGIKMEGVVEVFQHVVTLVGSDDPTGRQADSSPPSRKTGAGSPVKPRATAASRR